MKSAASERVAVQPSAAPLTQSSPSTVSTDPKPFFPEQPNPRGALALSVLTSIGVIASISLYTSRAYPCAALYPFLGTIFGGAFGFAWEIRGGPIDLVNIVTGVRRANVGLIIGYLLNLSVMASVASEGPFVNVFNVAVPAVAGWLAMYSWLGHDRWRVALVTPASILAMFILVFFFPLPQVVGSFFSRLLYGSAALVMLAANVLSPMAGPRNFSFVFHSLLSLSTLLLFFAVRTFDFSSLTSVVSGKPYAVASPVCSIFDGFGSVWEYLTLRTFAEPSLLIGFIAGLIAGVYTSKRNFNEFRYNIAATFWTILHRFLLSSAGPFPVPAGRADAPIDFASYDVMHPNAAPLSVPAATSVPLAQRFKYDLLRLIFSISDWADVNYPASDPLVHPRFKPRIEPRLGLSYYWNEKILGVPTPRTPPAMRDAFLRGELLSFALLYSHGYRDVREPTDTEMNAVNAATGQTPNRVLDYSKYEHYEQRDGFSPYGGKAFFVASDMDGNRCDEPGMVVHDLHLLAVLAPRDDADNFITVVRPEESTEDVSDLSKQPGYDHFNYIQRSIHSSSIFVAVVMHHLLEIHTVTSITSIALHNAFDTADEEGGSIEPHPFRAAMQLHYYSSTEVQEVTTPHLLNSYATFAQVFSLKAHATANALNDNFIDYEYLADCDFDARERWMNTPQMRDEKRYLEIFRAYAIAVVRATWGDVDNDCDGDLSDDERAAIDERLAADSRMSKFLRELSKRVKGNRLPSRFVADDEGEQEGQRWSIDGLVQFIAETVHLTTVRHQYLGTKMALASLDFRYSGLSAHYADDNPPPKEDYIALILIVAATALKPFPTLMDSEKFRTQKAVAASFTTYLGVKHPATNKLQKAYGELADKDGKQGLAALQREWETDGTDAIENRMRVMPNELHIMAGY